MKTKLLLSLVGLLPLTGCASISESYYDRTRIVSNPHTQQTYYELRNIPLVRDAKWYESTAGYNASLFFSPDPPKFIIHFDIKSDYHHMFENVHHLGKQYELLDHKNSKRDPSGLYYAIESFAIRETVDTMLKATCGEGTHDYYLQGRERSTTVGFNREVIAGFVAKLKALGLVKGYSCFDQP